MAVSLGIKRILINYFISNAIDLNEEHEVANNDERDQFILYKSSYSEYQFMIPVLTIITFLLRFIGVEVWKKIIHASY